MSSARKNNTELLKDEMDEIRQVLNSTAKTVTAAEGSLVVIKWLLGASSTVLIASVFSAFAWAFSTEGTMVRHDEAIRAFDSRMTNIERNQETLAEKANQQQNYTTALGQQITNLLSMQSDIKVSVNEMKIDVRKLQQSQERNEQQRRQQEQ